MTASIISKHFDFNRRPSIELNVLQLRMRAEVIRKIESGIYQLEPCTCPCGTGGSDEVLATRDRFGLPVCNVICRACGTIRINPRFTQETYRAFYECEYRKLYTGKDSEANIVAIFASQERSGADIHKFVSGAIGPDALACLSSVLEIGCSAGGILSHFRSRGHKVTGNDYDHRYLAYGRDVHGLELIQGSVDEIPAERRFDLVLMSHVFEHVTDPEAFVEKLAQRVRPGGFLYLHVPGVMYAPYYKYPPFDFLYYLQNAHPFTYTVRTLRRLFPSEQFAEIAGTEDVRILFKVEPGSPAATRPAAAEPALGSGEYERIITYIGDIERRRPPKYLYYRMTRPIARLRNVVLPKSHERSADL